MENLSNSAHRSKIQSQQNRRDREEAQGHDYLFEGHPVAIVETFSRGGKRIAVIEDREGEVFEVFFEQLD
ncbi:hypothetical protein [Sulfurimonas sp. HSL3-7]|uniref:hypothetical protein n=1 Tax=Sulfonitrofixus jiaomeiensis TaxID=3131938 RepID=UPI0031F91152